MSEELGNLQIKLGLDGANYNEQMKQISKELSNLGSQLKEQASRVDGFGSSLQGMKSKASILNQEIQLQKDRLSNLNTEYQRAVQEHGSMSSQALTLQTRMNGVGTAINKLQGELNSTNTSISNMQNKWLNLSTHLTEIEGQLKGMGSTMQSVGQTLTMSITAPLAGIATFGIKYNATMEDLQTSFKVMLGSQEKAVEMTNKLIKMGADTPFEATQLAEYTKTMLAFGYTANNVLPIMSRLGDISLGNNEKMSSLTRTMGQINSLGKLQGGDLNQLIGQGWNPLNEITKKTGETMEQVRKRMEDGKVTYKEVEGALIASTSAGGQFFNGMAEGAKTFNGQLSTLKDTLNQTLGEATKPLFEYFKNELPKIIQFFTDLGTSFSKLSPDTKMLILVLTGVAAIIPPIIVGAGLLISGIGSLAGTFATVSTAIAKAGGLMAFLSTSILPVITVIGGLIVAGILLYQNWDFIKAKGEELFRYLKPTFESIKAIINDAVSAVVSFVEPKIKQMVQFWKQYGDEITYFLKITWETVKGIFTTYFSVLLTIFNVQLEAIFSIIKIVWYNITGFLNIGWELIKGIFKTAMKILNGDWAGAWEEVKKMFTKVWDIIIETFSNLWNAVKKPIKTLIEGIKGTAREAEWAGKQVGMAVSNGIVKEVENGAVKAKGILESLKRDWTNYTSFVGPTAPSKSSSTSGSTNSLADSATKAKEDIEKNLYDISKDWIERRLKLNELSLQEELSAWQRVQAKFKEGTKEREDADEEVYKAKKKINDAITDAELKLTKAMLDTTKKYEEDKKKITEDAAKAQIDAENEFYTAYNDVINKANEAIKKESDVYINALDEKEKSLYSYMGLFDEVDKKQEQSGEQLLKNLKDQVDSFRGWQTDIGTLVKRGLDEGFIQELQSMGPKASSEIKQIANMSDPKLQEYVNLWKQKHELAATESGTELEKLRVNTEKKIIEIQNDTAFNLDGLKATYLEKQAKINENTSGQMLLLQDDYFQKMTGLELGAKDVLNTMVTDASLTGKNLMDGLINSISSKENEVMAVCNRIANAVATAFRQSLKIQSPSRVMMEIGSYIGQGLTSGIDSEKLNVSNSMNNLFNIPSIPSIPTASSAGNINITINGNLVGTNGMNELANIISNKISGKYNLSIGGGSF